MNYAVLGEEQVEQFLGQGHVKIDSCFEKGDIQDWIDLAFRRLGYQPDDATTWTETKVHLPSINHIDVADVAPQGLGGDL